MVDSNCENSKVVTAHFSKNHENWTDRLILGVTVNSACRFMENVQVELARYTRATGNFSRKSKNCINLVKVSLIC